MTDYPRNYRPLLSSVEDPPHRPPSVRALIEAYRHDVWNGAKSVTAEEVENTCVAEAHEFADFARAQGLDATVAYWTRPYPGSTRRPSPDEGHAVTIVDGFVIDWTAAQYGFGAFPLVKTLTPTCGPVESFS